MVTRKSKAVIGLLIACLLVATAVSGVTLFGKMNSYIEQSGEDSVSEVVEQMRQTYDAQINSYLNDLRLTDSYLFQNGTRSITSDQGQRFIQTLQQNTGSQLVFLKENGVATAIDGQTTRLEIQSQLLFDLQSGKSIAKLVSSSASGLQEDYYLIAIPCQAYYVDDEEYTALGALYDRSQIDSMLELTGFDGQALLFLTDKTGDITYTNLEGDSYTRNYSLLKHLKKDDALTDEQLGALESSFASGGQGVELLGATGRQYYLGYTSLQSSDITLVCIVGKSVTNSALIGYQATVTRTTVVLAVALIALLAAVVYSAYRAKVSTQKAQFETERRRLQDQSMRALEAEKAKAEAANRSKSDFLANMSHDIRTPMNAIVGLTKLMEHDKNDPEKMDDYLHKIQTSSQHLLSLINDVLDMSKIESSEVTLGREPISLAEQVAQVDSIIRSQAESRSQTFTIRVHELAHEHLIGDAMRLRQLFINLLSNAVKYTQNGGTVTLDLAQRESSDPSHTLLEITVTDNGRGMSPEFVQHIFEPFSRAEQSVTNRVQGTGLGMAIVKNILDLTGGTIDVQSEPGQGTRITVVLPFEVDESAGEAIDAQRVLLIASEQSLIANARAAFGQVSAQLFVAQTHAEARAVLDAQHIDTILLAGHIHDEELAHIVPLLRQEAQDAVLIFCVDYEQENQAYDILEADDVDGLISRPFFLSNFAHAVNQVREGSTAQPEVGSTLAGMRFLCAEDNELNAEILEAILDLNDATCTIYPDGRTIVDAFASVEPGQFDAILMDVQMPVMNGLDATRAIRHGENPLGRTIPIIAMTANAFSSDMQDCLDAGMDAHVAKPLDIAALERALANVGKQQG